VTNVARDSDQGLLPAGQVRLELAEYKDGGSFDVARRVQGVYDIATAVLSEHDATMEFIPPILGYDDNTAIGSAIVSPGVANVSWGPRGIFGGVLGATGSATFTLGPTAVRALWWYSPSLDRIFGVVADTSSNAVLVACSNATGVCKLSAAPAELEWSVLDFSDGIVRSWDSQRLVALPLMCCVCTTFVHFTYALDGSEELSLQSVPALNSNAAVAYDIARSEVWQAEGETSNGGSLTITQYDYATHTPTSATLSAAQITEVFGSGAWLPGWGIALIVVFCLLGLLAVSAMVAWHLRRARRNKAPKTALPTDTKASFPPATPSV